MPTVNLRPFPRFPAVPTLPFLPLSHLFSHGEAGTAPHRTAPNIHRNTPRKAPRGARGYCCSRHKRYYAQRSPFSQVPGAPSPWSFFGHRTPTCGPRFPPRAEQPRARRTGPLPRQGCTAERRARECCVQVHPCIWGGREWERAQCQRQGGGLLQVHGKAALCHDGRPEPCNNAFSEVKLNSRSLVCFTINQSRSKSIKVVLCRFTVHTYAIRRGGFPSP